MSIVPREAQHNSYFSNACVIKHKVSSIGDRPLSKTMQDSIDTTKISFGNAQVAGASRRGWFLGHFVETNDTDDRLLSTTALEVKWGAHAAGESRTRWSLNRTATTLSILIHGRFHLYFPDQDFLLSHEGDYVLWAPGIPHIWTAEEDSTIITVRYPSALGDIIEL